MALAQSFLTSVPGVQGPVTRASKQPACLFLTACYTISTIGCACPALQKETLLQISQKPYCWVRIWKHVPLSEGRIMKPGLGHGELPNPWVTLGRSKSRVPLPFSPLPNDGKQPLILSALYKPNPIPIKKRKKKKKPSMPTPKPSPWEKSLKMEWQSRHLEQSGSSIYCIKIAEHTFLFLNPK